MNERNQQETTMHLYKITMIAPVLNSAYYIVAAGFDEAEIIAVESDQGTGGTCGGVEKIERLCEAGGSEAGFTMSDVAAKSLGFE